MKFSHALLWVGVAGVVHAAAEDSKMVEGAEKVAEGLVKLPEGLDMLKSELYNETKTCFPDTYLIESVQDLKDNFNLLECIFWAGVAPVDIPLGPQITDTLSVKHNAVLGSFLNQLWQGHVFQETVCEKETKVFDQATLPFGVRPSVGLLSIEPLPVDLAEGEYDDGLSSLQIDYDINFKVECPLELPDAHKLQELSHSVFAPYVPINPPGAGLYYDSLRVVGKDSASGDVILLEKFYTNSYEGYISIGFNALLTSDPIITNSIPPGFQITLPNEFSYVQRSGLKIFTLMWSGVPNEFLTLPAEVNPLL